MGWCHEFGPEIRAGCDHPMVAGTDSCSCPECGVVCGGRFAGCRAVWDNGPHPVAFNKVGPTSTWVPTPEGPVSSNGGDSGARLADGSVRAVRMLDTPDGGPHERDDLRVLLHELRAQLTALPGQLQVALERALDQHHHSISRQVDELRDRLSEAPLGDWGEPCLPSGDEPNAAGTVQLSAETFERIVLALDQTVRLLRQHPELRVAGQSDDPKNRGPVEADRSAS